MLLRQYVNMAHSICRGIERPLISALRAQRSHGQNLSFFVKGEYMKLASCFLVALSFLLLPAAAHADRGVRCESYNRGYNYCHVRTRNRVQIDRQVSDSPCILGRTWGYDWNGVWVAKGCRADFSVAGSGGPNYGYY